MNEGFAIRDLRLPEDKPACLSFIYELQKYEHAFEPDRRIDAAVAEDYFSDLMKRVADEQGRVFVGEANGTAIGWAVFLVSQTYVYIVEEQRTYGYIAELFVTEQARGLGVGQALIKACEQEGRTRNLKVMMIGVLAANKHSASIYAQAGYSPYAMELRKYL
jgi:GNAT superfamily N-acetyltransferase